MSVESPRSPEQLIGKSVLEVISLLPTFPWYVEYGGRHVDVKIGRLCFVDYDIWRPRNRADLYGHLSVKQGTPVKMEKIFEMVKPKEGRTTGFTSLVWLDDDELKKGVYRGIERPWVHLPMIDMDVDIPEISQEEALSLIKKEIKERAEIEDGVILASGRENHFHFIGTKRLLTESQLPIFVGLCLNMMDSQRRRLVDTSWAGDVLTPMIHLVEDGRRDGMGRSAYDFTSKFATLRITTSEKKPNLPVVVDIL